MKHIFTILLTLMLLISLTACGGNKAKETMGNIETNPGVTEGSTAENQNTPAKPETTPAETAAETETTEEELQPLTDIDGSWHHHCFTVTDFPLFPGNYILNEVNNGKDFRVYSEGMAQDDYDDYLDLLLAMGTKSNNNPYVHPNDIASFSGLLVNEDGSFSVSLSLSKKGVLFLSASPNQQ